MIGMMMSPTSDVTIAPKAAPMITPTARSTTLPFIANSRNSFSMLASPLRSSGVVSHHPGSLIGSDSPEPGPTSLENALIDQAGMHHGAAHGDSRRLGHRHHRQPQLFFRLFPPP